MFLAGYVSDNKFATMGALRASAQVISFEIVTGLSLLGALLLCQTLDLRQMVALQQGACWLGGVIPVPKWGIVLQPLGFVLFFVAATVEIKRVPFDMPEGESEIIGYFIEYSGMKFLLFLMAEFIETLLFAWLMVLVFLGGWHFPGLQLSDVGPSGIFMENTLLLQLPYLAVAALQAAVFAGKVLVVMWLMMQIRWTLPRFRYDQVMSLGWKSMLPLALINFVITAAVILVVN